MNRFSCVRDYLDGQWKPTLKFRSFFAPVAPLSTMMTRN